MTHYRVSASSDSLANRGPQPRSLVLGERSESADVQRGSDEPHVLGSGTETKPNRYAAAGSGRRLEDAMANDSEELAQVRNMLDSRYDDIESARVKPVDAE